MGEADVRLKDRLEDNSICRISSSLYVVYNVRVTAILEDMDDFFTYKKKDGVQSLQPAPNN